MEIDRNVLVYTEKVKFVNFFSPGNIVLEVYSTLATVFVRNYDYVTVDELRKRAFCVIWNPT